MKRKGNAFYEAGSFYHRVKLLQEDGSVKYSKKGGFSSEQESEKSFKQCEESFQKQFRNYQASHGNKEEMGLRDYLRYWFEEVYSLRIENTTKALGAYTLYDLLLPKMEQDIKIRFLNTEYLDAVLSEAARISPSAGNKCRELLNLAMKDAVVQGWIKSNPVQGTKKYCRKKSSIQILGKDQIRVLLKAASGKPWYLEILLALFCGLRKGEIQGLKWKDVDMETGTVSISRQVTSDPVIRRGETKISSYKVVEKAPKTENSYRTLRMPKILMEEMQTRKLKIESDKKKLGESYHESGYISCRENGLPHAMSAFNNALTKLCSRNGLPHITPHSLRHMYATILLEQGVSIVQISALLGHASVHTTFECYCEVMDENEHIISFMNEKFIPKGSD